MIRLAEARDVDEVLPWLSEEEMSRFTALGIDPRSQLQEHLGPYTYCGVAEGKVACVWGLRFDMLVELPELWMIKTPVLARHKIEFLRENRKFIAWARAEFGPLQSCVMATNSISRRWLGWLGFYEFDHFDIYVRMRTDVE